MHARDTVLCKKAHSIMRYAGKEGPEQVMLAPRDFGGYVMLVNTDKESKVNCQVVKVLLAGALRILLVTKKSIKAGEQLTYFYGRGYVK